MGLLYQIYQTMKEQEADLDGEAERLGGRGEDKEQLSLIELLVHPVGRDKSADSLRERGDGWG
ncbi:hypothetical protein [Cohnella thermotolerans]|jgi:hypothetical protein|uniref:hypothetical protein n=1 Tax=Cohnella thermotolerans TaxID=329858 RepID=UPI00040C0D87|nr:hypothetical protein [Cohnella thermotolerans]